MDNMAQFEIDCDCCGKSYRDSFNQFIRKQINEGDVRRLIDDDLFTSICPYCAHKHFIDLPVVYADSEKRAVVFYCNNQLDFAQAQPFIEDRMEECGFNNTNGFFRTTSSQNELREKVILLENGLDDRVVEIMKLWALESLREEGYDDQFDEVRCGVLKDGTIAIDFVGKNSRHKTTPRNLYDKMEKTLLPTINQEETPLEVSVEYAIKFVTSHDC
jgi:hypothetical protein